MILSFWGFHNLPENFEVVLFSSIQLYLVLILGNDGFKHWFYIAFGTNRHILAKEAYALSTGWIDI